MYGVCGEALDDDDTDEHDEEDDGGADVYAPSVEAKRSAAGARDIAGSCSGSGSASESESAMPKSRARSARKASYLSCGSA